MAQKIYIVEGRQFRTEADYSRAMRDKGIIDKLRKMTEDYSTEQLKQLRKALQSGKYRFYTVLGQEYLDELDEEIRRREKEYDQPKERVKESGKADKKNERRNRPSVKKTEKKKTKKAKKQTEKKSNKKIDRKKNKKKEKIVDESLMDQFVQEELKKQEKRRKFMTVLCGMVATACLGYVAVYYYQDYKTTSTYDKMNELKEKPFIQKEAAKDNKVSVTLDGEKEIPEVLDEYKNLLNKNKKLIGWVKIADTNIDYPVMQTSDNEYYLDHNLNQEYDKNGSIFMDKDCDVITPSTNYILYGHHMKNGSMFGNLHLYASESYYEKHPYIEFDTIYEKGTYQVMYAFRSKVYSEEEIVFKYYQFIDANSELEFDSYMQEMAALSYYNTGVAARFGDQLLTLSTCDYQEKDGRFVVVAKKIK